MNIGTPIRKAMLVLLLLAMILTLVFIFTNSLRTPEESMEQSSAVGGLVALVFPPDTPLGGFIKEHIRKIAHFAEYALLGAEFAVFVIFYLQKRLLYSLVSVPAAFCIALLDEALQYISGRGPSVFDSLIDLAGFLSASLITYGVAYIVRFGLRMRRSINNSLEN